MLDRFPIFKKAVFNQYQGILVGGAAAFSLLLANPLPLVGLLGAELMTLPFLMDRLKRRIEIEKKHAARQVDEMTPGAAVRGPAGRLEGPLPAPAGSSATASRRTTAASRPRARACSPTSAASSTRSSPPA